MCTNGINEFANSRQTLKIDLILPITQTTFLYIRRPRTTTVYEETLEFFQRSKKPGTNILLPRNISSCRSSRGTPPVASIHHRVDGEARTTWTAVSRRVQENHQQPPSLGQEVKLITRGWSVSGPPSSWCATSGGRGVGGGGRGAGTACRGAFHRRPRPDRSLRIRTTRIKGGPTTARGKTTPRDPSRPGGAWWNSIRPVYHRASTAKNTVAFQKACCLLRRGRGGGGGGGGKDLGNASVHGSWYLTSGTTTSQNFSLVFGIFLSIGRRGHANMNAF